MNGQDLRELRKKHNLTQAELAEKINVSRKTINHYENGNPLSPAKTKLIEELFGIESHIGERNHKLLLVRKAKGLSQQEMADLLNIHRPALSKIENSLENRNVPKNTFQILKDKFNLNREWWENGKGEMFLD